MAAPSQAFANLPQAVEAKMTQRASIESGLKKTPALRGWTLDLSAFLLRNSSFLQKYFWKEAGFDKIKDVPGLDIPPRYDPTVIPLRMDNSSSTMIPLDYQPAETGISCQFHSAIDYHNAYISGSVTPYQVAQAILRLIHPKATASIHGASWIEIREEETLRAAKLSTERFASGKSLGLMDGVPFGVKADIQVKSFITSMGMQVDPELPCFQPATESAWPVLKLEEAGAIIIGINNMHENGSDTSGNNPTTGTPLNAYHHSYYPGGSSSGAGASLGVGLVPICLGTDAGGSVRIPGAWNGIYALKPTHHRLGCRNSTVSVVGPMAATVADLTAAYRLAAQPDPNDAVQGLFSVSVPPNPGMKRFIGLCQEWLASSDPTIQAMFREMTGYLTSHLGYHIVDIQLPYLEEGQLAHGAVCLSEAVDKTRSRGSGLTNWLTLLNCQGQVLLSTAQHASAMDLIKGAQLRQAIMQHLAWLFKQYPGLIILSPTVPFLGWEIHPDDARFGLSDGNRCWDSTRYTWLANFSGVPSVQFPIGYTTPPCGSGRLPVGAMGMGQWGCEEQLLVLAKEAETYLCEVCPQGRLRPQHWIDVLRLAEKEKSTDD